ncbi:hypothetical protein Ddc_11542 [Ditylenchus destructor]|nr:hypothetical protein Ddc_11542 [Ditylenchus destructor]
MSLVTISNQLLSMPGAWALIELCLELRLGSESSEDQAWGLRGSVLINTGSATLVISHCPKTSVIPLKSLALSTHPSITNGPAKVSIK